MFENQLVNTQNTFLSKVFMTLALTMIPTLLGLFVGSQMTATIISMGVWFPIIALVVLIGIIFAIRKYKDTPIGFGLLFVFTFIMGITISLSILSYLATPEGINIVMKAFIITILLFFVMSVIGYKTQKDLSSMGMYLFVALIALIIAGLVNLFVQSTLMSFVLSSFGAVIFSLFIMYDINQIVKGHVTSVTQATIALYLDFINLFLSILNILGLSRD